MKIIKANQTHSKVITRLVSELVSELGGKPFVVDETAAIEFIEQSMERKKYIAFLALDEKERAVGLITVGESGAVYSIRFY